jgi:hypothetical protein
MMKNRHFKNALLGIALAVVATYLFPAVLFTWVQGPSGLTVLFSLFPLYALLYTSWIVLPLSVGLGMLIPRIAIGKSRRAAALHGAGYGAIAGLVAMLAFASVFRVGPRDGVLWYTVISYCALWVGAYAFCRAKGQSLYR